MANTTKSEPEFDSLLKPLGESIDGKVILVSGANRGIGKAFVESFLAHGASKVYAACRSIESAEKAFPDFLETTSDGTKASGVVVPLKLDMGDPQTIQNIATVATDVDIVINNAGVLTRTTPLEGETAVQNLQYEMDINVYGFMRLANIFAPILEKRDGKGVLVQVNSVASMRCAAPNASTYSASKAASFSITQALRDQLRAKGVHVVSVHPGPINTDMLSDVPSLVAIAPPSSVVAESLIAAICSSTNLPSFLVYPDKKSKSMGKAYESYAKLVIEGGKAYGEE